MRHSGLFLFLTIAFAACRTTSMDQTRAPNELMQADIDFSNATAAHRIDAWVAAFAPNGSQIARDGKLVTGHEAIRGFMGPVFADSAFSLTWKPTHSEISEGGLLGYTWGRYESKGKSEDGKETVSHGRYLTIWKKQSDGTWKILFDLGDPDPKQ